MGREVRRVPIDWKHPTAPNPYWVQHHRGRPTPKLHPINEAFVPLLDGPFSEKLEEWRTEKLEWDAGEHEHLKSLLKMYSAEGYLNVDGTRDAPKLYNVYAEDGNTVVRSFHPANVQELLDVYPYEDYSGSEPDPKDYVPEWDVPVEELGYCLYETVSEGTPVTPSFATEEELIEHLATEGQDWAQEPMRREAAEALVRGGWAPSAMIVGNTFLKGDMDADVIAKLGEGEG